MIRHLLKLMWNRKRSNALIVAEIFVSFLVVFMVTTGAIFMFTTWSYPLGFDYREVWVVSVDMKQQTDDIWSEDAVNRMANIIRELRQDPHVWSVAGSNNTAYGFDNTEGSCMCNGHQVRFGMTEVTDDFAKVMGMKVVRGRWFGPEDDGVIWQPVVINEHAAREIFGDENPIGRRLDGGDPAVKANEVERVVGVVDAYRKAGEFSPPANFKFQRTRIGNADSRPPRYLLLRLRPGTSASFEPALARRLSSLAPGWSFDISRMEQDRNFMLRMLSAPILIGAVISAFLVLMVALGLTGVMWQNVTQRTREIGLRRALGATAPGVSRQILLEIMIIVTIAVSLGTALVVQIPVMGLTDWLVPEVFTAGLVSALALIYLLAAGCAFYPGWMASRIQPSDALRYE